MNDSDIREQYNIPYLHEYNTTHFHNLQLQGKHPHTYSTQCMFIQ